MSWESLNSKEFLRNVNQLSASRLLPPPSPPDSTKGDDPFLEPNGCSRYIEALDSPSELRYEPYIGTSNSLLGGRGCIMSLNHRSTFQRASTITNWGCFSSCRSRLQQIIAKRKINQGLKLYNKHKQTLAVRKWKSALKTIHDRNLKFCLLGYLFQAQMDFGKYAEAGEFGHAQLQISEELDSAQMRGEAYLNLARANERLGCYDTSLNYARHSLFESSDVTGYVHLVVASVHLELNPLKSLESFQSAHKLSGNDPALELQVYVGLSELFNRLQDIDRSTSYASKAYDLSQSLQLGDLNSRHHRAALLQMASTLRKQGEFGDAHDYCSEATRLALVSGDHATYVRSLRIMGDIYRKKLDLQKAFSNYETSMGGAAAMGDRIAQMESMDGAARCLEILRLDSKICNCRPLEFNKRLLQVAKSCGAKLLTRVIRLRLSHIYEALGDVTESKTNERLANQIEEELNLCCVFCLGKFEFDCLEPLQCGHIGHLRCVQEFRGGKKKRGNQCPECQRRLEGELLSLGSLSLRGSIESLNSNYHITSSV